ncbi:GH25 family lysozyme, partial [Streptococcus porci]
MTTYSDFKNQVLDKGFNIDGYAGYQCWDGYAKYCQYLGVPYANCTTSGYVKDIWNNRHTNGMSQNFDEVSTMEPGDIAVFKVDSDWTPYSHIAIFDSDAGGGYGW